MYSKEEAKILRQDFWTSYGRYMLRHSVDVEPVPNWLNYATGVKDIRFHCDATHNEVWYGIELTHKDVDLQGINYQQFLELETVLNRVFKEPLVWEEKVFVGKDKSIHRISVKRFHSFFDKSKWSELFQFYESGVLSFISFWEDYSFLFKELNRP